jgi:hypothetical protein
MAKLSQKAKITKQNKKRTEFCFLFKIEVKIYKAGGIQLVLV